MGSAQSVEPDQVETCGGNKVSMGFSLPRFKSPASTQYLEAQ